jgi:hypothetical protein
MINVTLQFPDKDRTGKSITEKDAEEWAASVKKAVESFTGIDLKLIEIKTVDQRTNLERGKQFDREQEFLNYGIARVKQFDREQEFLN